MTLVNPRMTLGNPFPSLVKCRGSQCSTLVDENHQGGYCRTCLCRLSPEARNRVLRTTRPKGKARA